MWARSNGRWVDEIEFTATQTSLNTRSYYFQALASTIYGDNNPGGKMPVTMYPKRYVNETDFLSMSMSNRSYKYGGKGRLNINQARGGHFPLDFVRFTTRAPIWCCIVRAGKQKKSN